MTVCERLNLLADVSFTTEGVTVITTLLGAMGAALVFIHRLLMTSKENEITRLQANVQSWKQMCLESLDNMEHLINESRRQEGKEPIHVVAPVIPESSSPPEQHQIDTSEIATARARVTAGTMYLGKPPRTAGNGKEKNSGETENKQDS